MPTQGLFLSNVNNNTSFVLCIILSLKKNKILTCFPFQQNKNKPCAMQIVRPQTGLILSDSKFFFHKS